MDYSYYAARHFDGQPENTHRATLTGDGYTTVWYLPREVRMSEFKNWLKNLPSMADYKLTGSDWRYVQIRDE